MTETRTTDSDFLHANFGLGGKIALITGAARGIGLGVAEALARAGAVVLLGDIDEAGAGASARRLRDAGLQARSVRLDVSDEPSVLEAMALLRTEIGGLDIIVNSAGIFPNKPIREMGSELWDKVLAVNLRGAFLVTRHGAELIVEGGGGGRIINISSINTRKSYVGMAHYDASKGGIEALTRAAALEYAPHAINVNAIAPGAVLTPGASANLEILSRIGGGAAEGAIEEFAKSIPQKKWASPMDIGLAVLCIAGPAADYITGQTIYVDGGLGLV